MDGTIRPAGAVPQDRVAEHLDRALGRQILALLDQDAVTDIYLDPPASRGQLSQLWVVEVGQAPRAVGTLTAAQARNIITAVAGALDTVVNREHPALEGELYGDGPRFTGALPPIVPAPAFAIRKPAAQIWTLRDYEARGDITARQRHVLEAAVLARDNMIIVGGTGSGKTTLLNAIGAAVAELTPNHRMVTIEGTRELRIACASHVPLRTTRHFDEHAALRFALRSMPDRIWVGEVRGAEVLDMLQAWNTGHDGCACTLHSNIATPTDALHRLEQCASIATASPQHKMIARLVNLVVCLQRDETGRRRVSSISRVEGYANDSYITTEIAA